MLTIRSSDIDLYPGSQEERLPGFSAQFPHICSHVLLPDGPAGACTWHWHKSMELFYVEKGALVYHTPGGQRLFRAGSGGMVNSNVLHRTQSLKNGTALRLHLFEAELLAGVPGGTVQQRYITPLVQRPGLELLALSPEVPGQAAALDLLRQSLYLDEDAFGYELRLQALLSEVWLAFVQQLPQLAPAAPERSTASDKVKQMILFMTAHAAEKLSVADIAAAAFCSERECYRCFGTCLHTTPRTTCRTSGCRWQASCSSRQSLPSPTSPSAAALAAAATLGRNSDSISAVRPPPTGQNGRILIRPGTNPIAGLPLRMLQWSRKKTSSYFIINQSRACSFGGRPCFGMVVTGTLAQMPPFDSTSLP